MKIIFAKNIGFCFGVKRALKIAERSLREDPRPIQFLGFLVHNERIIEKLKKKGGKIISNLRKAKKGTLLLRAHGEILDPKKLKKGIIIRETTCPFVKKAQKEAKNLFQNGFRVIIIGDKGHPEVKGIEKYLGKKILVIEKKSEAESLPKMKKIGVISQTTQDLKKVREILKILKRKAREVHWSNTLCPEVMRRQRELKKILKICDALVVIGSRFSANTKRLVQIAKRSKKRVFWINSLEELKKKKIKGIFTLGVVSGTSVPDEEVEKIKKRLSIFGQPRSAKDACLK